MKKTSKMVFVIIGCTGEYVDKKDWTLGFVHDRSIASSIAKKLNDKCKELGLLSSPNTRRVNIELPLIEEMKKLDKQFAVDYNGTRYSYYPINELKD